MSNTACLFAGQGAQSVGMGKELYENSAAARAILDQAEALHPGLLKLMFEGPAEDLNRTLNTQLAVLALDVAAWRDVQESIEPAAFAGFSLGEYAALVAAQVLPFDACFKLVERRAELMDAAAQKNPGGMAAILGMDTHDLEQICESVSQALNQTLLCANYNCPGQIVISGQTDAVQRAVERAKEAGGKARPLPVSGGFHSPLMQSAALALKEALPSFAFSDPVRQVYSNVTARPVTTAAEIQELLPRQMCSPVRFEQTLLNLQKAGIQDYIELGPGRTLSGFVKRTVRP